MASVPPGFRLGLEVLLGGRRGLVRGARVGLITNPTGVDQRLRSTVDLLRGDAEVKLVALYGPEHGVRGSAQAGAYLPPYVDERTGLPVHSLYGGTRKPTPEMLADVDVLLFDMQDVGARPYTYVTTLALALQAVGERGLPLIVLDRPNPLGGVEVQGPVLEPSYASFVGLYPLPLRHGLTVGELALFFNEASGLKADLTVVPMDGWGRAMYYDATPLQWVPPSPNLPTLTAALVYPGTVLLEGTNLSEGRGTAKPFELVGAPFINGDELAASLAASSLPGVMFRAASFTPTFSKHGGEPCHGVQLYVTDRQTYKPVETGLAVVKAVRDLYPGAFSFLSPEDGGPPFFDLLVGNGWVREGLLEGTAVAPLAQRWGPGLRRFKKQREPYLLYP